MFTTRERAILQAALNSFYAAMCDDACDADGAEFSPEEVEALQNKLDKAVAESQAAGFEPLPFPS